MPFSYANPTSGQSAGGIGWFDFGALTLNPGDSLTNLTGVLSNGITVKFDISVALTSGQARPFVTTPLPTYPGAYFGTMIYTGITGNVALYNDEAALPAVTTFTINNITLTNPDTTPVNNFAMVVADTESTGPTEGFQLVTNGGGWGLLEGQTPPILTGLGTSTANITGTLGLPQYAYVLYTQAPSQVNVSVINGNLSRQGFAIGFATTRVRLQKNIAGRIDPTDQFVLSINGSPSATATTTGNTDGLQPVVAGTFATPSTPYIFSESMAPGSASTLSQYTQTVTATNATPAGSIPPVGALPVTFTPELGDDVTYTIFNVAPEVFTKTVDKAFANIGEILTYTVRVDNPNNFAIANVLVTDATPTGTTYLGNIVASTAYTGTDLASGITITSIPADGFATISWQVQVNAAVGIPNPIVNVANVVVPGGTSGVSNMAMTQVNTAFLSLNKVVDKTFAVTGDIITYSIVVNNAGNVAANNITITDAIPAGTTFVPGSLIGATGTPPNLTLTGPVAAGGTVMVSFKVLVGDTIPAINPLTNTATSTYTFTVDPANPDGAGSTASSNTVSTQVNEAIVGMTKTVNPAFVDVNGILTYTITLNNTGNVAADNVVITDIIPAGTTFVPNSVVGATGTPPTLTLTAPIIAGGSSVVSFQVQVGNTLPNPNPILNSATSAFTFTEDPENPNGATGTSASNVVSAQVNNANVTTLKSVDKSYADVNDVLTYTLLLTNSGNVAANNVTINDVLPAGVTFIPGSLVNATGTLPNISLANPLAPNASITVSFQAKIDGSIPQPNPLANKATTTYVYVVDPANPEGVTVTSDSNTVTTQVNHAQVSAEKTVDKAFADLNDILTYTITLQNTGNVVANNVVLNDVIPAGTTYVAGSLTGATGTLPNLTLASPLGAGDSAIVTFKVKVTSTLPTNNPVNNVVAVSYAYTVDPADPNGAVAATTSEIVATQINNATLVISKSADKSISFLGDTITYQIAVKNTGNVAADNVVINDVLLPGLTYVTGSLVTNVPATGDPASGITLINPVAPGEVVTITFKAIVSTMPLPNPVENIATAAYSYTVDPADPDGVSATASSNAFNTIIFRNNYLQQINDVIESVALQEAAIAALANAEGAKIQKIVAMGTASTQELLCLNKSVSDMMASISLLEAVLKQKLSVLDCQIDGTKTC